jgi:hypothetical protein
MMKNRLVQILSLFRSITTITDMDTPYIRFFIISSIIPVRQQQSVHAKTFGHPVKKAKWLNPVRQ